MAIQWFLLGALAALAAADYDCLCNYNVELEVHTAMTDTSSPYGSLYEFDCKEQLKSQTVDAGWAAIALNHQIGYVKTGPNVEVQVCPGDAPTEDKVTTAAPATSPATTQPSTAATLLVTTSTPAPTTVTTTPAPTTTVTTTPVPTTVTTETTTTTVATTTTTATAVITTLPITQAPIVTTITTAPPVVTTSPSGIISGQTNLCPAALRSFTSQDHGALAQYDRSCYEMVPHSTTWPNAEADCRSKGAHLVQINTQAEQDFIFKWISTKLDRNTWIGLHDIHNESNYQWSSGESAVYTNWLSGQKPQHSTQDCVYINAHDGGYWDDEHCESSPAFLFPIPVRHPYICQYEIDTNTMVHGTVNPHGDGNTHLCPTTVVNHATRHHGYLGQYGQSCYELLPRYDVTWSHGETLCRQEGGHLAHINNADEQGFIQEFVEKYMPNHGAWIGLNDRAQEGHYTWSSGAPVTYTNWIKAHSGILVSPSREDCVLFLPYSYGHWNDVPCGQSSFFGGDIGETHPILCQFSTNHGSGIVG